MYYRNLNLRDRRHSGCRVRFGGCGKKNQGGHVRPPRNERSRSEEGNRDLSKSEAR